MDTPSIVDTFRNTILASSSREESSAIVEDIIAAEWEWTDDLYQQLVATVIVEAVRQAARGEGQGTRPRPIARSVN